LEVTRRAIVVVAAKGRYTGKPDEAELRAADDALRRWLALS